jgi:multicomponent K+:H+ antiporter subunit E
MSLRHRLVPHPLLSLTLVLVWILLTNNPGVSGFAGGILLGLVLPLATRAFWPERPRLQRPLLMFEYALVVLWDICVANVQVAMIILGKRNEQMRPAFIVIPLEITAPEAIAMLAGTITMTPGTVSADISDDGGSLLVHCLDAPEPDETLRQIKDRYEVRLVRMFE